MVTANLESTPFLDLPAELRITIYGIIIDTAPAELPAPEPLTDANLVPRRVPTSFDLLEYSGFIMSCKQIMEEFQSEWLPKFNNFLQAIDAVSPLLHVPCVSTLSHSIHLQIGLVHHEGYRYIGDRKSKLIDQIEQIFPLLPFFTLACMGCSFGCLRVMLNLPEFFHGCADDNHLGMHLGQSEDCDIVAYAWRETVQRGLVGGKGWRDLYWFDLNDMQYDESD